MKHEFWDKEYIENKFCFLEIFDSVLLEVSEYIKNYREEKQFVTTWDNMPAKLMLCVSELSEAMEDWRDNDKKHFAEEIADTMIRLLDICGSLEISIGGEIYKKMLVNEKRPSKHGRQRQDI